MNFSSLFGVLSGIAILLFSIRHSTPDWMMFLNMHGILIVCGGTFAAASISFPLNKIVALMRVFVLRVLGRNRVDYQGTISQILDLSKRAAAGPAALNDALPSIKHPFMKEAVSLVASGVLTEREIRQALEQRLRTVEERYLHEANMFRTIGRYPPAFGLLATTLGMIAVLRTLGSERAQNQIGPAMSIGLIGTLYGIALSNFVFLPIADNLTERTQEEMALRRVIIEGTLMLKSQVNPMTLRETMNSYLLPKDRIVRKSA